MTVHPQSILFTILPFIEQDNLYKVGMIGSVTDKTYTMGIESVVDTWAQPLITGPIHQQAFVKTFYCPTDSSNSTTETIAKTGWVGSSYAANVSVFGAAIRRDITLALGGGNYTIYGCIYNIGNIPDGTSNTVGIAERFAFARSADGSVSQACLWAYPPSQGLAIKGSANNILNGPVFGIATGPIVPVMNSGSSYGATVPDILSPDPYGATFNNPAPSGTYFLPEIDKDPSECRNAPFGAVASGHQEVVQVGMMDGSTRGVSAKVSQLTWNRAVQANDAAPLGADW